MRNTIAAIAVLTLVAAASSTAQQPNHPNASMTWNGYDGPSWPITGVPLAGGSQTTLLISGQSWAPFVLATAASLAPQGIPVGVEGVLDLDLASLQIVVDTTMNPAFALGFGGDWQLSGQAPNLPAGITVPYQAAVGDATAPSGVRLTAATELITTPAVVNLTLNLSDDGSQVINFGQYGFSLPFFGQSYQSLYVNSNGFISFQAGASDFTPSPSEMQSSMPRVALQWCDLSPQVSGSVTATIDHGSPVPSVLVNFDQVPDYGGQGSFHTFSYQHLADPVGDVIITHDVMNIGSIYAQIMGIAPGNGGPLNAVDFTAIHNGGGQYIAPGEGVYESFGYQGQPYHTGPTNTFDVIGRTFTFAPQSVGGYYLY